MVKGKQNTAYQTNYENDGGKLRGHFAYYGVTDNSKSLQSFAYWVTKNVV